MTQPTFVPISEADQVRPARHLHVPSGWTTSRPAELHVPTAPQGPSVGTPGPDAGFALRLVRRYEDELRLDEGENADDALVGCALIAARRAALTGRAPCVYDVQVALALWGFLVDAPRERRDVRRTMFASVSHDYVAQRALVDVMDEEVLRLTPAEAHARVQRGEPITRAPAPTPAA
ncbi:MAG: hypothetical protein ACLPVF_07165 [Acidimicrobiales bacterium]